MRNVFNNDGLLNNTLVKIVESTRYLIKVALLANGQTHYIPRINFKVSLPRKNFSITRVQFPLRSAYSRTINRSQGTTVDKLGLDLREESLRTESYLLHLAELEAARTSSFLRTSKTSNWRRETLFILNDCKLLYFMLTKLNACPIFNLL